MLSDTFWKGTSPDLPVKNVFLTHLSGRPFGCNTSVMQLKISNIIVLVKPNLLFKVKAVLQAHATVLIMPP